MHAKMRVRTPGNRIVFHKKRTVTGSVVCANCKAPLPGLYRLTPVGRSKISGTKKRVGRAYGGNLCSSCSRNMLKEKAFNL